MQTSATSTTTTTSPTEENPKTKQKWQQLPGFKAFVMIWLAMISGNGLIDG